LRRSATPARIVREARALCDRWNRKALEIRLLVLFSCTETVSTAAEQEFGAEHALVGQEAFLVDARNRIAKHVVAARKTARRASTVSKRAFSTVMDHRSGGSVTKASLGGAMHPLGMGHRRPGQNCGRDHRSGPSYGLA
jgi:hypothetical protein